MTLSVTEMKRPGHPRNAAWLLAATAAVVLVAVILVVVLFSGPSSRPQPIRRPHPAPAATQVPPLVGRPALPLPGSAIPPPPPTGSGPGTVRSTKG